MEKAEYRVPSFMLQLCSCKMAPKQVFANQAGDNDDTIGKVKTSYSESAYEMYYFSFYFFIFFNFYFYFILLYNTVLVLPYIDMNPPRVYMRSQT